MNTNPIYVKHCYWNKVAIIHFDGCHRVYKENKRKNTDLYLTRIGQEKTLKRLLNFGYQIISQIEFDNYFIKNNQKP